MLASLLVAAPLAAQERLAVLELFGRSICPNCQAAGRALVSLEPEMTGRAVLLEYDWDAFKAGLRAQRFLTVEQHAALLPLVMVGSGYRTSWGPVDYPQEYRRMIQEELARPPTAAVSVYSRRSGGGLRLYVRAENTGDAALTTGDQPTLWVIVWENGLIGVSDTFVRTAIPTLLPGPLAPGETTTITVDTPAMAVLEWNAIESLALLERGPARTGRYDTLQAAVALPAALTVTPQRLTLGPGRPPALLRLDGPHVLAWTATPDVAWLRVEPSGGTLPASPTVSLVPELRPSGATSGSVRIDARGDGMTFTTVVQVAVGASSPRPVSRRLVPGGSPTGD